MTVYSQNDPAWKNTKIGFDTGATDTIGNYGCYMTAIANVCSWAGNDLTPATINDLCKDHPGWLVSSDLIAIDSIPALLCTNLQYDGKTSWNDAVSMNFFADASSPDVAYIICIDASNAPGIQTHFVMVWATNGPSDLIINDSWDGVRKPLSDYGNPSVIIQSATKFSRIATPPPPPPAPVVVPTPAPPPTPVVTPPPPPPPSPAAITAPVSAPNTTPYPIVVDVPTFATITDAINHTNPTGTLAPSNIKYFKFSTLQGMVAITTVPGTTQRTWINPADNVVQAVDPGDAVKASWRWFYATHEPVEYKVLQDIVVSDMVHSGKPISVATGHSLDIYGTFQKSGKTYLRPFTPGDETTGYYFYGIQTTDYNSGAPYLDNEFNTTDKIKYGWEAFYDKAVKTIEGIFHPKKSK